MIQLKELTLGYGQRILLDKVSARITGGQLVALLGRNGTGKSTLLRAIMGLEKPQTGEIVLQGKNIASLKPEKLARNISFVTTDKVRIANLRCEDVVALGRAPYTNWIGQLQPADQERVDKAMQLVGMSGYADKTMDKMSDGECQRIMIARALAQDTPVVLLDEPTAFLDLPNRYELCLLLKKLAQEEGKCILFSTHDLDIALSLCDFIMLIDNPQLYSLPRKAFPKQIRHIRCTGDESPNQISTSNHTVNHTETKLTFRPLGYFHSRLWTILSIFSHKDALSLTLRT